MSFGQSSERLAQQIEQLELTLDELEGEAGTCNCPDCGGPLRPLGEDSDEMLDVLPVQ